MNVIDRFIDNYAVENTKYNYKMHLNNFFRQLNIKNPEKYFETGRNYDQDILDFQKKMSGRPPKTIKASVSIVKTFFLSNNIELQPKTKFQLRTRRRGSRAWTQDKIFTQDDLKKILQYGNAKSRALFLLASSTGCRIGELLQIKLNDLDLNHDPLKINVRGEYTKSGDPRIVFGSDEAKDVLKSWLRERDNWLKRTCIKRNNGKYKAKKNPDDDRVFPFSYTNVREIWRVMINKAGYDERDPRTNRRKYHVHGLRKYFRSRIGIDVDVTEALMGHEEGVRTIYRKYTEEQLAEMYKKGMYHLSVFEREADTSDIRESLQEKDQQISNLERMMQELKAQVIEMRLERMERANGIKKK